MNRFDIAREISTGKKVAIVEVENVAALSDPATTATPNYIVRDINRLGIRVGELRVVPGEDLEEWKSSTIPARGTTPA